jgi:NACHT domain-containing protein
VRQPSGRLTWVFTVSLISSIVLPVVTNVASGGLTDLARRYSWVVWVVTVLLGLVVAATQAKGIQRLRHGLSTDEQRGLAVHHLARVVEDEWRAEAATRELRQLDPLRLVWSWSADSPPSALAGVDQAHLAGSRNLADLGRLWRKLPRRQLVLVGEPGSGKSTAAMICTLRLVEQVANGDPVPVLLGVSSWDPRTETLHYWMARQIYTRYTFLKDPGRYGHDPVTRLLAEFRIVPVLDGLDEMPPQLLEAAFASLDGILGEGAPLIVTCRKREFAAARRAFERPLGSAAVVEVDPVDVNDAIDYLAGPDGLADPRWRRLADALRGDPQSGATTALTSPLLVGLGRWVYSAPGSSPEELAAYADPVDVENHVLDAMIPRAYADRPRSPDSVGELRSVYGSAQARRWLTFIARRMDRLDSYDLRWWEVIRWPRFLVYCAVLTLAATVIPLVALIVVGAVAAIAGALQGDTAAAHSLPEDSGVGVAVGAALSLLLPAMILTVLAVWVTGGFRRRAQPTPHASLRTMVGYAGRGLLAGALVGLVLGGIIDFLLVGASKLQIVTSEPPLGSVETAIALLVGPGVGLFLGLSFGPVVGVLRSFRVPETGLRSATPRSSIAGAARMAATAAVLIPVLLAATPSLIVGAAFSVAELAASGFVFDGGQNTFIGSGAFVAAIVLFLLLTYGMPALLLSSQWIRFRLVAGYYAGTGRLPWRLLRFLDDAHRRGVLRREGPVYQFRHAHLQDRLAAGSVMPTTRTVRWEKAQRRHLRERSSL